MAPPQHDPLELERIAQQYRSFGRFEMATHGSPIYAAICTGLADDPATGRIALGARPGFRTPLILLAAVHHLLLEGMEHPLAGYYPTLRGEAARPIDDGLYPAFADLVATNRARVEHLVATRSTQTNEARRAVVVLPALCLVAREAGTPLALLEAGASAGLNLSLDRFGFRIGRVPAGDRASPVQIEADVHGELLPPVGDPPAIAWRAGLDLNPLDVADAGTVAWLRALVWPEHTDRMAILQAAVALAREDPPRLVRGDMVDDLPALAEEAPAGAALVVTGTWVLAYVPPDRRRAFMAGLGMLSRRLHRSIRFVSCEGQDVAASLDLGLADSPPDGSVGFSVLTLHRLEPDGEAEHTTLALCHAHGRWIRWLDRSTAAGHA